MTFRSALPRNTVPTLLSARAESASADSARVRSLKPAAVAAGSLLVHSKPPPSMAVTAIRVAARPRDFVGVRGPGAEAFLQAMLSNDVEKLAVGDACEALLLTPKARVIAPMVVHRRAVDDFLLLTEPGAGEPVRAALLRMRFAARCEIELEERAIDFAKGCYPGQEPIARQHYRGRVNRSLRVLQVEGAELPEYDAELSHEGKAIGRVTSAARDGDRVVVLAYVRVEVPRDAVLDVEGRAARPLH